MSKLIEYIDAREAEVKEQMAALKAELDELRVARDAIKARSAAAAFSPSSRQTERKDRLTHRQMVLAVLEEHPEGGERNTVKQWVKDRFEIDMPETSVSSHLSRLRSQDQQVAFNSTTKFWRAAAYADANAGFELSPDENEADESSTDEPTSDADAEGAVTPPAPNLQLTPTRVFS